MNFVTSTAKSGGTKVSNPLPAPSPSHAPQKRKAFNDTILLTASVVKEWLAPPFQRPIKHNAKVRDLALELRQNGGVLTGVITLGNLNGKLYLIDGQHRKESFTLSGIAEGYADIRILSFDSFAEMGEEFVKLNSQLARMNPDDILRGLEQTMSVLANIRKSCPFVGYDNIRRGQRANPMVSMSVALRIWKGSETETPQHRAGTPSELASALTEEDAGNLCDFLNLCYEAFGRDPESYKLWGTLNLLLCMWLYRRIVLKQYSQRVVRITKELFRKCLQSVSASAPYSDWLVGRAVGERDRSPAYGRIKAMFARRIQDETGKKIQLPSPPWDNSGGSGKLRV